MDTMISEMEIGLEIPDCFSSFGSQSSEDSHLTTCILTQAQRSYATASLNP